MLDRGFWASRRVLVTGHTGFKGAWLSLWLQQLGAEVAGYSLDPPTEPSLFAEARAGEGMLDRRGDVRSLEEVSALLADQRSEVVIHMAAQSLVRTSFENPAETYDINVMGTATVLEAVRLANDVRVAVIVTSDKCYENREWEWGYRENEAMGGHDPYSSSKGVAELVTSAYRRSFFSDASAAAIASARAGNVIGGGDWAVDRLVPDLMRGAELGQPVLIRNPAAVRPWQHVLNPLSGYLRLAEVLWERRDLAGPYNFGPEDPDVRTVADVAERLVALWGDGLGWDQDPGAHPHEAHTLKLDSARARTRLGWHPAWGLDRALESIVSFHQAHQAGGDVRAVVEDQIRDFETVALSPASANGQ